jgi:hypothetical protein
VGALRGVDRMYVDLGAAQGAALLGRLDLARARADRVFHANEHPNHDNVSSRLRRVLRFVEGVDSAPEHPLRPADRALDDLRRGVMSGDKALEVLGPAAAVAERLLATSVAHLHRYYPQ